jgi:hypothetical protein
MSQERQDPDTCKHDQITITEQGSMFSSHTRQDGEWSHDNSVGDYNNKILVECHDCWTEFKYFRSQLPVWVEKAMNEFLEN